MHNARYNATIDFIDFFDPHPHPTLAGSGFSGGHPRKMHAGQVKNGL
jgi:hypothetical protein